MNSSKTPHIFPHFLDSSLKSRTQINKCIHMRVIDDTKKYECDKNREQYTKPINYLRLQLIIKWLLM